MNKELKKLAAVARQQCWTVEFTAGDHYKWSPPQGGDFVITSATPSAQRTISNIKSNLKGRGLVLDMTQYKRYQKEVAEVARDEGIRLPLTDREAAAVIALALSTDNEVDMTCEFHDPPKTFISPVGAEMHRQHCKARKSFIESNPPSTDRPQEDEVKRDMTDPPQRERLNCPICPFYCWISQPHILDSHLRSEHGQGECPHCHELWKIAKGGLTNHIKHCEKLPRVDRPAAASTEVLESVEPEVVAVEMPDGRVSVVPTAHPEDIPDPAPTPEETVIAAQSDPIPPGPVAAPPRPPAAPRPLRAVTSSATDDELWDLLELILDGPITVNRHTLSTVNTWMDATRALLSIKEES